MEQPRVRVERTPTRCPFCHDEASAQDTVACMACLARHHVTCWDEAARCASCGHQERLEKSSSAQGDPAAQGTSVRSQDLVTTVDVLRAVAPGAFRLRTGVPILLVLCVVVPLVVHVEHMRSFFNVRRLLVGMPTLLLWGHAAGWLVSGELRRLDVVLAELAGGRWLLFLVALAAPLWIIWTIA